ncbi:cyclic GMP-AMP synthase-like receptor [Episyrphus balteatus]|uniref:cyclic GMP-AMP synthase-like receptor n=1 Tax=Episyrphus balteatus TaxID=286459 RepID=UPI00248697FB|nr:cyclic GMP-AMP synthase-like receptor [Episyrphus balteatus]XP_055837771.1 cyclic GMP-AMP synthase-like receptor [Episyrphus balteatus]
MEEFYHSISKAINIDVDREEYTKLYDFVRQSIINGLKENEIFKALFADLSLCGSYADNLKVTKPNEFDLVVRLEFPFPDDVHLEEDPLNGGNVWINLVSVIHKVDTQNPRREFLYKFLKHITNDSGYLLLDKFQSWFEGTLTKYLIKISHTLTYNYEKILLRYKKQGPAHTITVRSCSYDEISIDFVPGFRFSKSQSVSPFSELIEECDTWEAIPKPAIGKSSNPSFQCSYTESERRLLTGRNQFKNALRMMKKFRDMNPGLVNLKSYYIKTLFLWHSQLYEQNYWNNPNESIMDDMFEALETALKKREIKFFWDKEVNLLRFLSNNQIDVMYHEVRNARKIISKRSESQDLQNIKDLFLTKEEQNVMPQQLEMEIEKNFWEIAKEKVAAATPYLPWVAGAAAGAVILGAVFFGRNRNNNN